MKAKSFVTVLKWLWIAAVIIATAFYLIKNWDSMRLFLSSVSLGSLLAASVLLLIGKLLLVILSKWSLQSEGFTFGFSTLFQIVALSQLGKYIPGGVWHFLGRINMYKEQEVSLKKSTRALIIENVWLLSGAVAVGLAFGLLSPQVLTMLAQIGLQTSRNVGLVLAAAITALWFGALMLFDRLYRLRVKKMDTQRVLRVILLQIITWICLSGSFTLLWPQFKLENIPLAICVYSLSWSVGYVAIFAPGGIGIREGMLTWLLSGVMAPSQALALSTVHRFLYIIVEIFMGLTSLSLLFLARLKYHKVNSEDDSSLSN